MTSYNSNIPRISVIMGIYNCASTLEEALDSLLTQTYQGFKVIMCDDGSKDNTVNVAQSYVDKYPGKFILIKNESNQGLNKTLNNCLKLVDTEYVARMDGDDVCMPERLKTQIDFLDSHKDYAFVSTSMICFDNEGDFMTLTLKEGSPSKKNFVKSTPFFHATVLVRAEAYKNVGGYSVNEKLLRVEDYHLWFKMYAAGYRGYNLSAPYYKMRDDRNAIARRTWKNRRNEAYVKIVGYKMLHLPIYYYPYALVPIMKALLPTKLYTYLHRRR